MDDEFVADSEGEGDLAYSPLKVVSQATDATFDDIFAPRAQPSAKAYSLSSISQYPSTVNATATQALDSPIVEFTATTGASSLKKRVGRPKAPIIDLSDLDDDEPSLPKIRKNKNASPKKKEKQDKKGKKPRKKSVDDDDFSIIGSEENAPLKATKKRKSVAKQRIEDEEDSTYETFNLPSRPSKKRKSPDEDVPPVEKPTKKRKKNSPAVEEEDEQDQVWPAKKQKRGRKAVLDDDESPDELLLTNDTPLSPKKGKQGLQVPLLRILIRRRE
ncbi:hypothetical protein M408DRAFT_19699 [Serendipita vermifera MAFF 305830]|uniref:Uncharacterized protein n=1 Tax=Serendipita vermifera MAFF 305830 TaxID=933852 RepID=A0A0C3BMR6_SERVB|nr:hypothetical protein M408DRAFT_19699 [Serendipita vermifera MAFF 305830]